ncbi:hypothetical protein N781_04920 [Pontibacillus halophilus JSM 076056 = DSM 19796]|uniref:Uncharacterized protein n=1 Tax=Pontibacillus halophilus JSM 076056 = DSM 19796 TaxID=1385510 RepID=A0A0A5GJ31_9BACI|nr:helix-turn-helix domain-containing protein [Pontibacillus halophilus]KGX91155.1 hypothetical protein N781_04920 [Pontibacillus halophilus JSM 076056 = DSM 19796]
MYRSELREYQTFRTKKEMDERVRGFVQRWKYELSEGNYEVLRFIWRHSVKFPGVSYAKVETIMKGTKKSRSTVVRSIRRFVELGLLTRVETVRANGKRGVNLLVIQPYRNHVEKDDTLPDTVKDTVWTRGEPLRQQASRVLRTVETERIHKETNPNKENIVREANAFNLTYLPSHIPRSFAKVAQPYLTLCEIEEAWKRVVTAYAEVRLYGDLYDYEDSIIEVLKPCLYVWMIGKVKSGFMPYFYGAVREEFRRLVRHQVHNDRDNPYYDWLHE